MADEILDEHLFTDAGDLVRANMDAINDRIAANIAASNTALTALSTFDLSLPSVQPPEFALAGPSIPLIVAPTAPTDGTEFGTINPFTNPGYVDLSADAGISSDLVLTPSPFAPTVGLPVFPDPLGQLDISGAPDRPSIDTTTTFPDAPQDIDTSGSPFRPSITAPTIPAAPTFDTPPLPSLVSITIPDAPVYDEPTFDGVRPSFDGIAPTDTFNWAEPTYTGPVIDNLEARIQTMLAGGTGLPIVVQDALFSAARSREDLTALSARQVAFDEWAGRGFGMPPGMLVKQVNAANEQAQLQANALSRDILTKAATWEIENLRYAVEKGIALESMVHGWFEVVVGRSFEVAKYHLEVEMKLYELAITKFNAFQQAYQTDATVFRALIDARIGRLTAYKTAIDGQIAKGQINDQAIRLYLGEWEGVKAMISVYSEQLRGVEAVTSNNRATLEGYATDVSAWNSLLNARKIPFEVYGQQVSAVRGKVETKRLIQEGYSLDLKSWAELLAARKTAWEAQKLNVDMEQVHGSVYESQARAFAETVRAASIEKDNKRAFVELRISVIRASIEKYQATLSAERERVQSELNEIQARTAAFSADTGRYRAELESLSETRRAEISVAQDQTRNQLAYYETRVREYDASLQRQQHRLDQALEALKAVGQFTTAALAGASSALHVSAGISGSGSVSGSSSLSRTQKLPDIT